MMQVFRYLAIYLLLGICVASCGEEVFTPKPKAYPKVELPTNEGYQTFDKTYCNMKFEYPSFAEIIQDTVFFDEKPKDECWFDIAIPSLNSKVHCSFVPISTKDPLDELIKDSYELVSKHNIKADYIDEYVISKNDVHGVCFEVQGTVASHFQFYLTDSTDNFFRGSMYFNSKANADSLRPVANFVQKEIMHMVNTFEWTN